MNINEHMELLGLRVRDRVTGIEGVVTSVCFDLYGCIQAILNRGLDKDGKPHESFWYDISRLEVTDDAPVMRRPDYNWTPPGVAAGAKGPAERPREMKP